ncbi:hypothetical protein BKA65DRAFT_5389 [Rhexocercosporidium sp. MPI-PUGE-AT-0058]|nr:hypothetical protein BKA65DRAFT_5389 [Rhexocercosporidium sp. MPI-PUGE-AT-0058]
MDPLSITASTVALATLCMKVSTTVYEFTTDVRDVVTNVQNLYHGLRSLSEVLTNVSTAWSENPLVALAQSGPDGNLWICVKDSVGNCEVVLKKLEAVLDKVSAENAVGKGFMRRPVKQIRLNLNKRDIQGFSSEVQTYERALVIAFNAISACAAMRRDHTDAEVTKRLETIETGIQDLSQSLRQRQPSGVSASSKATKSLEQFLQAANTFKSTASTVVNGDTSTVRGGLLSQGGGSIFGDSLLDDRFEIIQSWIPLPSPQGTRGSLTAVGSTQQGSLPGLMAVLETVTQMADQYRNSEQEENSRKDEQLRSLEMEHRVLEEKFKKNQASLVKHMEDQNRVAMENLRLVGELRTSKRHRAQLASSITELEEKLGKRDIEAAELHENLQQLKSKLSLAEETLGEELNNSARLKADQNSLHKENRRYESEITKLHQELGESAHLQKQKEVEIDRERSRAEKSEEESVQLLLERDRLKWRVQQLRMHLQDVGHKFNTSEKDLALEMKKAKQAEGTLKQLASLQQQQSNLLSVYSTPPETTSAVPEPEAPQASTATPQDERPVKKQDEKQAEDERSATSIERREATPEKDKQSTENLETKENRLQQARAREVWLASLTQSRERWVRPTIIS